MKKRRLLSIARLHVSPVSALTLGLLGLFFIVCLKVLLGVSQLSTLGDQMRTMTLREVPEERLIGELRSLAAEWKTAIRLTLISNVAPGFHQDGNQVSERTRSTLDAYRALYPEDEPADESVILNDLEARFVELTKTSQRILSLRQDHQAGAAQALFASTWDQQHHGALETLDELVKHEAHSLIATASETKRFIRTSRNASVALAVLGIALSIALASIVVLYITRPVDAIRMAMERVKRGDPVLEAELNRVDRISPLTRTFNEMLEQLHRSFEDVCHEIRAPMTILRGEAETALRDPDNQVSDYRLTLKNIVTTSRQMARLVDDVMFLSRSEVGQIPYEMSDVDLRDVLREVVRQSQVLASPKGITLEYGEQAGEGGSYTIVGDPGRLHQLFFILFDNAIKYSRSEGQITLRVSGNADSVDAVVSDSGSGIPADELPLIFQRFYRSAAARREGTRGSGLGLSIARSIAQVHRASIEFESEPGRGTIARVRMPLRGIPAPMGGFPAYRTAAIKSKRKG